MTMESIVRRGVALALGSALILGGGDRAESAGASVTAAPTVFMAERDGVLLQTVEVGWPGPDGEFAVMTEAGGRSWQERIEVEPGARTVSVMVPACEEASCEAHLSIIDDAGQTVVNGVFSLPYQRRWTVYLSPFSHIDVGFTNSQRKILAQNLDNLRAALDLIRETRDWPPGSRFRFFTEVSWPLYEFLYGEGATDDEKQRMIEALRSGEIEAGAFTISHQNKFMPAEALFRSADPALQISRDFGAPIRTGCLNDLTDMSGVVKPLAAAGAKYFVAGTNTAHYLAPPLFYLEPPSGRERVLTWLTPNLNGYGENFDFAMKLELPIAETGLLEVRDRLGAYLKALETSGAPPLAVREHFDFQGLTWPYPYDVYFLPFYPAHAVDNGPQDITPSELTREWNSRFAWPRLIVANPAEFFERAESEWAGEIPTLRGELPGFWGEQVFFAFAQVDPLKEAGQRNFERETTAYEMAAARATLLGGPPLNLAGPIARAYTLICLNNDHNPRPGPLRPCQL